MLMLTWPKLICTVHYRYVCMYVNKRRTGLGSFCENNQKRLKGKEKAYHGRGREWLW